MLSFDVLAHAAAPMTMVRVLAQASGTAGMAGGQALDLAAVGRHLDLPSLEEMHRRKTGALISASVAMAAACAPGLAPQVRDALDEYARDVGLAFQIRDDILDVEGNTLDLGKQAGADAARSKPTYASLLGLEGAKARAQALKNRACERVAPLGRNAQNLAALAAYVVDRRA